MSKKKKKKSKKKPSPSIRRDPGLSSLSTQEIGFLCQHLSKVPVKIIIARGLFDLLDEEFRARQPKQKDPT